MLGGDQRTGGVVLRLDGHFDEARARGVACALAGLSPGCRALVDFRGVRSIEDFAFAWVAEAMAGKVAQVSLVGLGRHHRRILASLGIADGSAAPAAEADEAAAAPERATAAPDGLHGTFTHPSRSRHAPAGK